MQEHKQYTKKRDLETNAKRYPERRQVNEEKDTERYSYRDKQ